MVTLKNIKKENDMLTCEYYKEDSQTPSGTIGVSMYDTDTYVIKTNTGEYPSFDPYVAHAIRKLRNIIQEKDELKKECIVMWY